VGISALHMYVTVTSPYQLDRGVTKSRVRGSLKDGLSVQEDQEYCTNSSYTSGATGVPEPRTRTLKVSLWPLPRLFISWVGNLSLSSPFYLDVIVNPDPFRIHLLIELSSTKILW